MHDPPFPVVDASDWAARAEEPAGAEAKIWLVHPDTRQHWLFKPVTVKSGHVHGEDWAEKVASELGGLLGVPCAEVELASRGGENGPLSLNLRPDGYSMHDGAVLLSEAIPGYVPGSERTAGRLGHNLSNIRHALLGALPHPKGPCPEDFTAFDAFAGMLVLDAWIANRDRHDGNWSVLEPHDEGVSRRLCGAYDQAGGLGFNVPDARRAAILERNDVARWALRGTAWRFEHTDKPRTLVALAAEGLAMASTTARHHWLGRLRKVTDDNVTALLDRVPVLSDPARTFAFEVLRINRERLLDECR